MMVMMKMKEMERWQYLLDAPDVPDVPVTTSGESGDESDIEEMDREEAEDLRKEAEELNPELLTPIQALASTVPVTDTADTAGLEAAAAAAARGTLLSTDKTGEEINEVMDGNQGSDTTVGRSTVGLDTAIEKSSEQLEAENARLLIQVLSTNSVITQY